MVLNCLKTYHTLQESIEHYNEVVKQQSKNVFHNQKFTFFGYDRNKNLYQRLPTKQILSFLNLNSNPDPIQKWQSGDSFSSDIISPPMHLQLFQFSDWLKSFF